MPVYVDSQRNRFRRMRMCHMLADTPAELFAMAEHVGLRPHWFQPTSTPHFDLCQAKRRLAIEAGALEVDRRRIVEVIRQIRANPDPWRPFIAARVTDEIRFLLNNC